MDMNQVYMYMYMYYCMYSIKISCSIIIIITLLFLQGDIGKEMYIVSQGGVVVVEEMNNKITVLAELGPGSIFGEIRYR